MPLPGEDLAKAAAKGGFEGLRKFMRRLAVEAYNRKVEAVEELQPGLMMEAQRYFLLTQTDTLWKEHLQVWGVCGGGSVERKESVGWLCGGGAALPPADSDGHAVEGAPVGVRGVEGEVWGGKVGGLMMEAQRCFLLTYTGTCRCGGEVWGLG